MPVLWLWVGQQPLGSRHEVTGAHRRWPLPVTGRLWWSLTVPSWSHVPDGLECPWLPGKRAHVVLFLPPTRALPSSSPGSPLLCFLGSGMAGSRSSGVTWKSQRPALRLCCKGIVIVAGTPQPSEREFVP